MGKDASNTSISSRKDSRANEPPTPTSNKNSTGLKPHKSLKSLAEDNLKSNNPTMLGDPISLKAEASIAAPTPGEEGAGTAFGPKGSNDPTAQKDQKPGGEKSLTELAKKNATRLGDPVSLKAETADSNPTEHDRGAMSEPDRLKRGAKI